MQESVKIKVIFKELKNKRNSIRVAIDTDIFDFKYIHLPPFHKLDNREKSRFYPIDLNVAHYTEIKVNYGHEPCVVKYDLIDLTHQWDFLKFNQVYKIIHFYFHQLIRLLGK